MKKLKVLHIMSQHGGGISAFIYNKAKEMPRQGVLFDVVTFHPCPDDFSQAIQDTGGDIFLMSNPKKEGWQKFKAGFLQALQSKNYDAIHCHIAGYRSVVYRYLTQRYSPTPFYIHAHTAVEKANPIMNRMEQWLTRRTSDAVVGCGQKAIDVVYGSGVPLSDRVIIPNSIQAEDFIKQEPEAQALRQVFRQEFQVKDDEVLIGHIGRLHPVKNHALTLNIAQVIKERGYKGKIVITGAGDLHDALEEEVASRGLEEIVKFSGRISPISDYYPALDVMILPSFAEGLPTVVVEAQAAGVPCLLSDTITHEVDLGLGLVDYLSLTAGSEAWLSSIVNLYDKQNRPDASKRLKSIQDQGFTNAASAERYVEFLKENT